VESRYHSTDHKALTRSSILQTARGYAAKGIPAFTPKGKQPPTPQPELADRHRRELEDGSGISPEYIASRGYYTASRLADVPDVFKGRQRRLGLVIPTFSPSGSTGFRLRPNVRISPGRKYEQAAGVGSILDVHPLNLERVRDSGIELWVTEGEKTADSLASRGECVISIPGVHNFAEKGSRGVEGLPCWDYVPLQGRTVNVVFDSDTLTNPSIQLALERLVTLLEGRGASVYVVYLPEVGDA
jgi:hypothetical protein